MTYQAPTTSLRPKSRPTTVDSSPRPPSRPTRQPSTPKDNSSFGSFVSPTNTGSGGLASPTKPKKQEEKPSMVDRFWSLFDSTGGTVPEDDTTSSSERALSFYDSVDMTIPEVPQVSPTSELAPAAIDPYVGAVGTGNRGVAPNTMDSYLQGDADIEAIMPPATPSGLMSPPTQEDTDAAVVEAMGTPEQAPESVRTSLSNPLEDTKGQLPSTQRSIEGTDTYVGGREIQQSLTNAGFRTTVDGQVGNNTRKNIGKYQASIGLPATGHVDRETQQALNASRTGSTEQELLERLDFVGGTPAGSALMAAEEMLFNPYSLNGQPRLSGGRRHNSGLTIGVGVDLGQQSAEELRRLDVPEEIVTKLEASGWLGLQPVNAAGAPTDRYRTAGHAFMKNKFDEQAQNGTLLTLSPEELDGLTEALYDNKYLPDLRRAYNSTVTSETTPFEDLTDEAVAAMGAEAWHYTSNIRNNAESFAQAAAQNDLEGITALYLYPDRGPRVIRSLQ